MELQKLHRDFTVCKVRDYSLVDMDGEFCFVGKTDGERSLVCTGDAVPANATARDDGWKGLRVRGALDFSLVGILSGISTVLAENAIPLFAVSTYDTDYIFVKAEKYQKALDVLVGAGYRVVDE